MTEVVPVDRTKLLHQKRQECTSIVRTRKRKLRELFAVATTTDGVPKHSLADPDVQPSTPAELDFLRHCDIVQGKKFNEHAIPTRPPLRLDFASKPTNRASPLLSNTSSLGSAKRELTPDLRQPSVSNSPSLASARLHGSDRSQLQPVPQHDAQNHALQTPQPAPIASPGPPNGPPSRTAQPNVPSKLSSDLKVSNGENEQNGPRLAGIEAQSTSTESTHPQHPGVQPVAVSPLSITPPNSDTTAAHIPVSHTTGSILAPQQLITTSDGVTSSHEADAGPLQASSPKDAGKLEPARQTTQLEVSDVSQPTRKPSPLQEKKPQQETTQPKNNVNGTTHNSVATFSTGPAIQKAGPITPAIQQRPTPVSKPSSSSHQGPAVKKIAMSNGQVKAPTTATTAANHSGDSARSSSMHAPPKISQDNQAPKPVDASRQPTAQLVNHVALKTGPNTHATPALTERPFEPLQLGPSENSHHRSVSEVLAQPPPDLLVESQTESGDSHVGPITPISQSSKARPRGVQKAKSKDKSKMSMVVFGKQLGRSAEKSKALVQSRAKPSQGPAEDYFTPLFVQAFASSSKWMKPLDQVLNQAHKTVSTPDAYTQILDHQACRVLRRVYSLQHHDKWSLRQPKRCPEPTRPPSHWDVLLKEMKWMRTDFRQEKKWKMAAARSMAYACADWVAATSSERTGMQVAAVIPPRDTAAEDIDSAIRDALDEQLAENHPTPDLVPSADLDSLVDEEEPHQNIFETVAPSAIFSLQQDDLVFPLQHSPSTDRLLEELPMYGSPLSVPKAGPSSPEFDPDAAWRRPALPLSRFVEGEMKLMSPDAPRRRSRYRHQLEDEDEDDDEIVFGSPGEKHPQVEPQNPDVALFRSENRMMRDRLHAGHQFRPPNEHSMPFQTFYESRSPSQWTQSEDDELKGLVREYSYNWSLISTNLATKSLFVSGAERRTPWECFERWVMLEGLPHDMQKTQYFKLWQNRIESAQQMVRQQAQNALQQSQQQQQTQQQQPNISNSGPVTPLPRRRQSIPLKVERRRNQKHLTMIDAMRKLAKKRETAQAKQQQAASLAAMRKAQSTEAAQPRQPTKTPREYSIMRYERDQAMAEKLAERVAAHQQRQDASRRAQMQARAQQGQAAQLAAQNGAQNSQIAPPLAAAQANGSAVRPQVPGHAAVNGQARPRMSMQSVPNGAGAAGHPNGGLVPPMHPNGAGQVQMPIVNGQARMSMPNQQANMQLLMQAQRIQEQQRQSVQIQQQQQQPQPQHQQQQHAQIHQQHQGHQPTPQQQQLQMQQVQQANVQMQNSPPAMRAAALASLSQKSFMNNPQAQALIASMSAANSAGMSTPPTPGFSAPSGGVGSPPVASPGIPQQTHQTYISQLQHIEGQLRQSQPNAPADMIRQMARQLLQNRQNTIMQSAMNAAAGGAAGQTAAANGPHQYAQLLRAQQQQQQAQAAAQAQQQVQQQGQQQGQQQPGPHHAPIQGQAQTSPVLAQQTAQQRLQQAQQAQQQNAQQHRNSSGTATPTPAATL
ncbi:chromatin modification-related protein VID21 [Microdochium nivale]|nr:chromatin modification-related protein VID21 [Microdochium nivale]